MMISHVAVFALLWVVQYTSGTEEYYPCGQDLDCVRVTLAQLTGLTAVIGDARDYYIDTERVTYPLPYIYGTSSGHNNYTGFAGCQINNFFQDGENTYLSVNLTTVKVASEHQLSIRQPYKKQYVPVSFSGVGVYDFGNMYLTITFYGVENLSLENSAAFVSIGRAEFDVADFVEAAKNDKILAKALQIIFANPEPYIREIAAGLSERIARAFLYAQIVSPASEENTSADILYTPIEPSNNEGSKITLVDNLSSQVVDEEKNTEPTNGNYFENLNLNESAGDDIYNAIIKHTEIPKTPSESELFANAKDFLKDLFGSTEDLNKSSQPLEFVYPVGSILNDLEFDSAAVTSETSVNDESTENIGLDFNMLNLLNAGSIGETENEQEYTKQTKDNANFDAFNFNLLNPFNNGLFSLNENLESQNADMLNSQNNVNSASNYYTDQENSNDILLTPQDSEINKREILDPENFETVLDGFETISLLEPIPQTKYLADSSNYLKSIVDTGNNQITELISRSQNNKNKDSEIGSISDLKENFEQMEPFSKIFEQISTNPKDNQNGLVEIENLLSQAVTSSKKYVDNLVNPDVIDQSSAQFDSSITNPISLWQGQADSILNNESVQRFPQLLENTYDTSKKVAENIGFGLGDILSSDSAVIATYINSDSSSEQPLTGLRDQSNDALSNIKDSNLDSLSDSFKKQMNYINFDDKTLQTPLEDFFENVKERSFGNGEETIQSVSELMDSLTQQLNKPQLENIGTLDSYLDIPNTDDILRKSLNQPQKSDNLYDLTNTQQIQNKPPESGQSDEEATLKSNAENLKDLLSVLVNKIGNVLSSGVTELTSPLDHFENEITSSFLIPSNEELENIIIAYVNNIPGILSYLEKNGISFNNFLKDLKTKVLSDIFKTIYPIFNPELQTTNNINELISILAEKIRKMVMELSLSLQNNDSKKAYLSIPTNEELDKIIQKYIIEIPSIMSYLNNTGVSVSDFLKELKQKLISKIFDTFIDPLDQTDKSKSIDNFDSQSTQPGLEITNPNNMAFTTSLKSQRALSDDSSPTATKGTNSKIMNTLLARTTQPHSTSLPSLTDAVHSLESNVKSTYGASFQPDILLKTPPSTVDITIPDKSSGKETLSSEFYSFIPTTASSTASKEKVVAPVLNEEADSEEESNAISKVKEDEVEEKERDCDGPGRMTCRINKIVKDSTTQARATVNGLGNTFSSFFNGFTSMFG